MIAKDCVYFRWVTEIEKGIAAADSIPYCRLFKVELSESFCNECEYFQIERRSNVGRRQGERRSKNEHM